MRKIAEYLTTKSDAQKILQIYDLDPSIVKSGGIIANRVKSAELYMTMTKQASVKLYNFDGSVHEEQRKETVFIPLMGKPAELKREKLASLMPNSSGYFEGGGLATEPIRLSKVADGPLGTEFFGLGLRTGVKVAGLIDKTGKVAEIKLRQTPNGAFVLVPGNWQFASTKVASANPKSDEFIKFANGRYILKSNGQLTQIDDEKFKVKLASVGITDSATVNSIVDKLKSGATLHIQYTQVKQASVQKKPLSLYKPVLKKLAIQLSELPEDVANIAIELRKLDLTPARLQDAVRAITELLEKLIIVYWDVLQTAEEPGSIDPEKLRDIIISLDKVKSELEQQHSLQKGGV